MTAQNIHKFLFLNEFSPIKEFTDGLWNGPYTTGPKLEKLLFKVPCSLQVFNVRRLTPGRFGENYGAIWQLNSYRLECF